MLKDKNNKIKDVRKNRTDIEIIRKRIVQIKRKVGEIDKKIINLRDRYNIERNQETINIIGQYYLQNKSYVKSKINKNKLLIKIK